MDIFSRKCCQPGLETSIELSGLTCSDATAITITASVLGVIGTCADVVIPATELMSLRHVRVQHDLTATK